jgi:hypothetical protein
MRLAILYIFPKTRIAGMRLRRGAEKSFADYVGQKISQKIQELFRNDTY